MAISVGITRDLFIRSLIEDRLKSEGHNIKYIDWT